MVVECKICNEEFPQIHGLRDHMEKNHAKPWRDEQTLRRLHQQYGMSGRQIAQKFGCSPSTVPRWINKFNIYTPPKFQTTPDKGYEKWRDGNDTVYVHRLLAVAEYGFQAVKDNIVHHKSGVPWDNRPDNIEVLPQSKHHGEHTKSPEKERKAIAFAYEFTNMSSYDIAETCDYSPQSVVRIWREYFDG